MRVTGVRSVIVDPGAGKNWLFVRVDTDAGISGWGECYTQSDRDQSIIPHITQLGRYLTGRDPHQIKHFTFMAYHDYAGKRGAMEFYSALSGIEQALWDIVGKAAGQPVYNLLGGACRTKIRVYANGWYHGAKDPDTLARLAEETVKRGHRALKFDPFPGPWRTHIDRSVEEAAIENVRAVREAVGPDVEILVEVHRRLAPMHAVRIAERMEEFRPFWFEEPVSARNLDALATAAHAIRLPVVTGEELYTKAEFREVFEKQAAEIINPDVCNTGGILELKEIAAMAEPYLVVVSPHNYNSTTIGLAATLQVAACIPNFLITEYFVNFRPRGDEISAQPFVVQDGSIDLPTGPGLGLELREDVMARYPYREFPARALPHPADEAF
ncbi:MAG: mandelate racemase/muconate lactonizing enzyme family protein [Dehalococcoidia bacterium]